MVFDINHGCSGYIYGLNIADSLFQSNNFKKILLFTADTYSKYCKNLLQKVFSTSSDKLNGACMGGSSPKAKIIIFWILLKNFWGY